MRSAARAELRETRAEVRFCGHGSEHRVGVRFGALFGDGHLEFPGGVSRGRAGECGGCGGGGGVVCVLVAAGEGEGGWGGV